MALKFSSRRNFIKRIFYAISAVFAYQTLPGIVQADETIELAQNTASKKKAAKKKAAKKKSAKKKAAKKKAAKKKKAVKKTHT